jgi:PAS domain S-box-containing protein
MTGSVLQSSARHRRDGLKEAWRTALSLVDDAVVAMDAAGRIEWMNAAAERLIGQRWSEAVGRPLAEIVRPLDPAMYLGACHEASAREAWGGSDAAFACRCVTVDGSEREIEASTCAVRDDAGNVVGWILVGREIPRRAGDAILSEQSPEWREALEHAPLGIAWLDLDGAVLELNAAARRWFGDGSQETLRRPLADLSAEPEMLRQALREVLQGESVVTRPVRMRSSDRSVKTLLLDASGCWKAGSLVGVRCYFRECATADDESQALLAAIVASSEDAIVSKSLDGVILSWNAGAERLFGYSSAEAVGQRIAIIIPPERHAEEATILERLRRGERIHHLETERVAKDGRRLDISLTVSPVRDTAGRVVAASKIARDITERKRFQRELQSASRRKDEFLATLAHELRNPLAPIRNAVKIIQTAPMADPRLAWSCGVVERQVGQMARLLDDLLDASRITRNRLELYRTTVSLGDVIAAAVETSRPHVDAGCHELSVVLPAEPILLEADGVRLAQVFSNLLNNAAKFTPPPGRIRVSAERHEGEVVICVQDSGIGIPAHVLPRLFEMFSQADSSAAHSRHGLGIGLALAKGLVELHGGRVEACSQGAGQGSEFRVRLPVAATALRPRGVLERAKQTPAGPSRRVLIADDLKDHADSLALMLRVAGHEVHAVYDGAQAVAIAAAVRPEVVVLDLGMPGVDGYEACRRIREQPEGNGITIIAVSGWGQPQDRKRSRSAGFDRHLVKPVDPHELLQAVVTAGVSSTAQRRRKRPEDGATR